MAPAAAVKPNRHSYSLITGVPFGVTPDITSVSAETQLVKNPVRLVTWILSVTPFS